MHACITRCHGLNEHVTHERDGVSTSRMKQPLSCDQLLVALLLHFNSQLGVAAITVFLAREDIGVQMLVVMAVIMAALAAQVREGGKTGRLDWWLLYIRSQSSRRSTE